MAQDPNTEAKYTVIINSEWVESESTVSFIIALKKTLLWGINFLKSCLGSTRSGAGWWKKKKSGLNEGAVLMDQKAQHGHEVSSFQDDLLV